MIHLDTSSLVDALAGTCSSAPVLRQLIDRGERIGISTLVLYEWLRGPRTEGELAAQEAVCPREQAIPFGVTEAELAARLYASLSRPRARAIDLGVAACALTHGAWLWTLNPEDFRDIPDLRLVRSERPIGNAPGAPAGRRRGPRRPPS